MQKLILAAALALGTIQTFGQDITNAVISFSQAALTNRTISATVYPIYSPDIVVNGKKDVFGGGLAVVTPVSAIPAISSNAVAQHTFIMLRGDYLAHAAFASSGSVGAKFDFQLWGHNFEIYGEAGANIPITGFGGKNGTVGAMVGSGLYTDIWKISDNFDLGVQLTAEKWTQFDGMQYLGGPVLTFKF